MPGKKPQVLSVSSEIPLKEGQLQVEVRYNTAGHRRRLYSRGKKKYFKILGPKDRHEK